MKKLIVFCLMCAATLNVFTQQTAQNDVVLKLNGEELTGKVIKISDNDIEFSYAGETLAYTIKKADIMKITFASGRIEVFNKPLLPSEKKQESGSGTQTAAAPATSLADHHNKVAILPSTFIKDGQSTADALAEQVQNECFSMLSKHAGVYVILDPRNTNAILVKAGVNKENIKGYTMEELCGILGVEYVVDCMVSVNKTSQTVTQSNTGQVKDKNDKGNKDKTINTYSSGTATQNYKTNLALAIYNDKGASVYNQERNSFWDTQNAYKSTLEYLLKRSPLYTK